MRLRQRMNCRKLFRGLRVDYAHLVILVSTILPLPLTKAAEPITLKVEATRGLPGLHHSALSCFIAARMAQAGPTGWRFEPAEADVFAPDRVEWTIRLNAFAGGEVRNVARLLIDQRTSHGHRPITLEVRLYLNGEYQTLVESQAIINDGGSRDDPHLADAVANVTQSLLGPSGAYRAIDPG